MFSKSWRISLVVFLLFVAGSAQATGWQQKVTFWSSNIEDPGWSRVFHPDATQALSQLPSGVQTMLRTEIQDNPWLAGHEEMQKKLGKFGPESRQVFDLPYIPIPEDKMKFAYLDGNTSANMRQNVVYSENGKSLIRFFFHPLYADKYKDLINEYGVRYGEYWATSTSSPRSLVVWKRTEPSKPIWVKVSLHAQIDHYVRANGTKVGISRVQSEKKARRSALVNAAFSSIKPQEFGNHQVEFMPEPASFVPGDIQVSGRRIGFDRSTIFRELPKVLTRSNDSTKYIPAFAFIKGLKETAQRNRIDVLELAKKGLMEPLVRTYLYLGLEHGLQGELHTQNFLLEVNARTGLPTGKVMVKDLDGFRMDLDMRIRNGRDISYLEGYAHPFAWAKHGATQGSSEYPAVLQAWYNKLIRNVNGFTTSRNGQTIYSTPAGQLMVALQTDFPALFSRLRNEAITARPELRNDRSKADRNTVERIFDQVARSQFEKITGIEIPEAKWGWRQNEGLNYGLNRLREQLFASQRGLEGQPAQTILKRTWERLRTPGERQKDERTWTKYTPHTFRLLGDGVIEAISSRGKPAGYAILKQGDMQQLQRDLRSASLRMPHRGRARTQLARYSQANRAHRVNYRTNRSR
ncbi:MAG: hypothetical protein V1754_13580 [Pseudomonadota bacterium]